MSIQDAGISINGAAHAHGFEAAALRLNVDDLTPEFGVHGLNGDSRSHGLSFASSETSSHSRPPDFNSDAVRDQVLATASDMPSTASLPALVDPAADHQDEAIALRRQDVAEKQKRIADWLDATGYDAVVLGRADSLAWFTAGGDLGQTTTSEMGSVLLFLNRTSRAVIADNVQSPRVFEEELAGLGFQLKERGWHQDPTLFAMEMGKGKRIAADHALYGWPNELDKLKGLRSSLTKWDRLRLRELGWTLAREVESTCRNFLPGETEADVAGHLAHRLIRQGVTPLDIRVAADGRTDRYRQPTFKAARIQRYAVITATGRRHGLCATLTRIVSFGPPPEELRQALTVAAMVDASAVFFSRPGTTVSEVFKRVRRIYEKFGWANEWEADYQGSLTGYAPREAQLLPEDGLILPPDCALCWGPSVGPARSQDTITINDRGFELMTKTRNWPMIDVTVKGFSLPRPDILIR